MRNRSFAWVFAASAMVATSIVSAAASTAGLDGSSNAVCAAIDVVGCTEGGKCVEGTAASFDLPAFMILDAGKKVIRAAYESGHKGESPVKNMERSGDHLVMQGVENGRGWNLAINTKTGRMSASVVGDAVSFLVFGSCTAL
jgi:hypothetical protein